MKARRIIELITAVLMASAVGGAAISRQIRQPLGNIKGLPPGLEQFANSDGIVDVYSAARYSEKAFDTDGDGKLSTEELASARKQVHDATSWAWYENIYRTSINLQEALSQIEFEQKQD